MSASRCGALYFLSGFRTNFLFRLSRFPRGLPGAEFFYENYVCYMMFCENSSAGVEVEVAFDLLGFKTSYGCTFQGQYKGTLRQASLPRGALCTVLKKCLRTF